MPRVASCRHAFRQFRLRSFTTPSCLRPTVRNRKPDRTPPRGTHRGRSQSNADWRWTNPRDIWQEFKATTLQAAPLIAPRMSKPSREPSVLIPQIKSYYWKVCGYGLQHFVAGPHDRVTKTPNVASERWAGGEAAPPGGTGASRLQQRAAASNRFSGDTPRWRGRRGRRS